MVDRHNRFSHSKQIRAYSFTMSQENNTPPAPAPTIINWTLPAVLSPRLSDREAITDTLYRALLAFDTNSLDLLASAMVPTATMSINGMYMHGWDAIRAGCFDRVAQLDTTHMATNVRVHIHHNDDKRSAAAASVTATVLSQHYRVGTGGLEGGGVAPRYLAGALYRLEMVRDDEEKEEDGDGLWKIGECHVKSTWAEGDREVVMKP